MHIYNVCFSEFGSEVNKVDPRATRTHGPQWWLTYEDCPETVWLRV